MSRTHTVIRNDSVSGPVIASSPRTPSNREFVHALGRWLHRPTLFGVPTSLVRLVLGAVRAELLLEAPCVYPAKAIRSRFKFKYPDLDDALDNLLQP